MVFGTIIHHHSTKYSYCNWNLNQSSPTVCCSKITFQSKHFYTWSGSFIFLQNKVILSMQHRAFLSLWNTFIFDLKHHHFWILWQPSRLITVLVTLKSHSLPLLVITTPVILCLREFARCHVRFVLVLSLHLSSGFTKLSGKLLRNVIYKLLLRICLNS